MGVAPITVVAIILGTARITVVVEDITLEGSIQEVTSPATRPESIVHNRVLEANRCGSTRMSKQELLQRLVGSTATNRGLLPNRMEAWQRLKSLTPREVDVLCYVLGGQLNKEIAAELGIRERTIKAHRARVMEKLGVESSGQLLAMVLGLVLTEK
jgi:DNA-binding NarL/FixJ family response regulator